MKRQGIVPVVLCGGAGTRLWPLSRKAYPKQLLSFSKEAGSLLQKTILRLKNIPFLTPPMIICHEMYRFAVLEQLSAIGYLEPNIVLEPYTKNTAPSITIAALSVSKETLLLIVPSDHILKNQSDFQKAVHHAAHIARQGYLVTFGIPPKEVHTGYGYIKKGLPLSEMGIGYHVATFIEKPTLEKATEYVASDDYYWNSGMFLFSAATCLEEMTRFSPEIVSICRDTLRSAKQDKAFIRLEPEAFVHCESDSIDYAVMQQSDRVAMIPLCDSGWSDLGTWNAIYAMQEKDENNNVIHGDVCIKQVSDCYVHAETRLVAAVGVHHHIIVETADAVLVAHKDASQEVKALVNQLSNEKRNEVEQHRLVHRPWGYYEVIDSGEQVQVKRIVVNPFASLSLQMHQFRSEHWIVIKGSATVTSGEKKLILNENESTYIPALSKHRLQNQNKDPLIIIEVQTGSYLGEDDIIRFDDAYGRE